MVLNNKLLIIKAKKEEKTYTRKYHKFLSFPYFKFSKLALIFGAISFDIISNTKSPLAKT